jgi:hypothetical protein
VAIVGIQAVDGATIAPLLSSAQVPERPAQVTDTVLAWFNANGLARGSYALGPLLPAGLEQDELETTYLTGSSKIGQAPVAEVLWFRLPGAIPEPATAVLAGAILLCGAWCRPVRTVVSWDVGC